MVSMNRNGLAIDDSTFFIDRKIVYAWTFMENGSIDFHVQRGNRVVTDRPSFLELTGGDMEFLPVDRRKSLR